MKLILKGKAIIIKLLVIFITGFSLYANKSMIGFYKDGRKIENTVMEKKETATEMENLSISQRNIRENIMKFSHEKLGSKYVWGAAGPDTFDCSGFAQYVFKKSTGISIPRVSSDQAAYSPRLSLLSMKKGDLIFFDTTGKGRISHVGIYIGERQFIHASSSGKRVIISSLNTGYYMKRFRWGGNMLIKPY